MVSKAYRSQRHNWLLRIAFLFKVIYNWGLSFTVRLTLTRVYYTLFHGRLTFPLIINNRNVHSHTSHLDFRDFRLGIITPHTGCPIRPGVILLTISENVNKIGCGEGI